MDIISDYLIKDSRSLSRLCLLNRFHYPRLLQNLYRWVQLPGSESTSVFCQSIRTSPHDTGKLVRTLQLCRQDWETTCAETAARLALEIHDVLSFMNGLQCLFVEEHTESISELKFKGLNAPFQLTRFRGRCHSQYTLFSFLRTQPSITDIHLLDHFDFRINSFCNLIEEEAELLPLLRRVAAHPGIVPCLVRSRPVSHVGILLRWSEDWLDLSALELSSVAVTSVHYKKLTRVWERWLRIANAAGSANACMLLKHLVLSEIDPVSLYALAPNIDSCDGLE